MWMTILCCGILLSGFDGIVIGQTDVYPSTDGERQPVSELPTGTFSVTLNPVPAVDEYCPFLLNCTVIPSQKGVSVVQLLKFQHQTWSPVCIYDSESQELQFIQDGVQFTVAPPVYLINVTAALGDDAGMYRCQANDSSGAEFQDSKNVTVKGVADDCEAVCQNGAMCTYGCQTHTCICAANWKGGTCEDACVNARTLKNSSDVILGNNVTTTCVANSKSSTIFWSRTATDFNSSSIDKLTQNGTLTIIRALAGDAGLYYCYVNNSDCVTRQQFTVNVIWDVPPTNSVANNLQKTEGESLELSCNVTTRPAAVFYWRFAIDTSEKDLPSKARDCHQSSSPSTSASPSSSASRSSASPSSSASRSSASPSSSTTSAGNVTRVTDALLCDPPTTTIMLPAILGNKSRGLSRLFMNSLASTDSGQYTCYAELPGEMTFILSVYNVAVRPAATEKPNSGSKTSSADNLLQLWMVAIIVYGIMLTGVGIFLAVFMFRLKYDNKKDPQVMPVCDEVDISCNVKCESPSDDICDGDDLYGYYEQQDEAPDDDENLAPSTGVHGNGHSQFTGQPEQQQIKSYLQDLPPLHGQSKLQQTPAASDRQNWNSPPLNDLSAGLVANMVGANSLSPLNPGDSGEGGVGPGMDRRRRRKIIRE